MFLNCGVGEDSWESLGLQGDPTVHPQGNQSWIGRTGVEAETPILWPPDAKNILIGKDPDAGKDWRWEEKGMTEDEMVGWCHRLDGHEFQQVLGVGDGQGGLACCSPWDRRVGCDWVTELNWYLLVIICPVLESLKLQKVTISVMFSIGSCKCFYYKWFSKSNLTLL